MAIEKRKGRRTRVKLPIKIIYQGNRQITAETENISILGTYLEIDRQIPLGTDVDIALQAPAYTKNLSLTGDIKIEGNIFRCNPVREVESRKYYGIGIFFTNFPNDADKDKLSSYIDFLVTKEEKNIRAGARVLQEKRALATESKKMRQRRTNQPDSQAQALNLLKQILTRLDEISQLLKSGLAK